MWLFIGSDRINLDKVEGVRLDAGGSKGILIITGTEEFRYSAESIEGQLVSWFFGRANEFTSIMCEWRDVGMAGLDLFRFKSIYDRRIAEVEAKAAKASVEANIFPHPDNDNAGRAE